MCNERTCDGRRAENREVDERFKKEKKIQAEEVAGEVQGGMERRCERRTGVEGKWKETEGKSGNERRGEENMNREEN